MMGMTGVCSRLIGDLVHAFHGVSRYSSTQAHIHDEGCKPQNASKVDESMARALITVFGMETNGRIKKEKAKRVVENLGLICHDDEDDDKSKFDLPGDDDHDEVPVEEVLGELESDDGSKRNEMLLEAFKIFDEDGNGFIEAVELKRVLECLGLDNGWDMAEIEKMVKVVDLNLDGKVDFREFELMMG
ncbi:hypothetical protein M0R45_012170 [Rubus argutus]|uniref:EF-hand domain-containing protein n=1 Tax=Rubus argutus TaxID=59490 RepID=A0AAW1YGL4_RUBAR